MSKAPTISAKCEVREDQDHAARTGRTRGRAAGRGRPEIGRGRPEIERPQIVEVALAVEAAE